jgi:uncharacterized membrane protein YkoI
MILTFGVAGVLTAGGTAYAFASSDDGVQGDDARRATDAAIDAAGGGSITELEADDGGYDVEVVTDDGRKVDVVLGSDFQVLHTDPDDDTDDNTDDDTDYDTDDLSAADAALAEAGGGTVVDAERDGAGYDVEVRFADGTSLEVELAADFTVVRTEADD